MAASREDYSNDAFVGVNAAQSRCELYYGSSSIFAFLQNIHQTFHDPDGEAADRGDQDQGMRRFQHEDRFFTSEQLSRTNPDEGKSRYALLPESLARQFLDIYIKSLHYLMPWSSGIDLVHMLDMMYSPEVEKQLQMPKGDTAVTLLALACGATFFKHSGWIDVLVERALAQVPRLEVVINLKSVQISLLLAHVLVCCGRHNSAYLYLGSAVRKAFAAGLHKNIDYPVANRQNPGDRAEVRRLTFWSLAFFERWFSFWQGRPSAIDGILVSRPLPETSPLVKALAELSDIVVQAGHRIYDNVCPQLTKLWEAAQHVRFELLSFQKRMRPLLGFDLDDETQLLDGHPVQVFLINFYYHTWMITFRPFLVISMSWKQHHPEIPTSGTRTSADPSLPIDLWWLPEACQIVVEKARRFIMLFSTAAKHNPIIRGLVFSASYVESACCLLFYDSLADHQTMGANIRSMKEAMDCLSSMVRTGPVPGVMATLQRMLYELGRVNTNAASSLPLVTGGAAMTAGQPGETCPQTTVPNPDVGAGVAGTLPIQQYTFLLPDIQSGTDQFCMNWSHTLPFMNMDNGDGLFGPDLGDDWVPGLYNTRTT